MPYITLPASPRNHQLTWQDLLLGVEGNYASCSAMPHAGDTVTAFRREVPERLARATDVSFLISALETFAASHEALYAAPRQELYHTYFIPKRSGGRRRIDEPLPDLMAALRELKSILEERFNALHHTAAFAYVKGRSTVDAVKRHQTNASRWFLKTDFSNFFGSTTPGFVMEMLSNIHPFSEVCATERGRAALERALDLCFLNGGLPQGTPISPTLTNLMMVPVDHFLMNDLRKEHFIYTRYADDILISSREKFDHAAMVQRIDAALHRFGAPFRIKPEKTRFGSSAGSNWNLGVMLNRDNQITVGRKRKEQLKGMVCSYLRDRTEKPWPLEDIRYMQGIMSYIAMVEPDYMKGFIAYIQRKHGADLPALIRTDLNGR